MKTSLYKFDGSDFDKGAGIIKQSIWHLINSIFFKSSFFPFTIVKIAMLKRFGAHIGKGLILKPSVNIKFPWKLVIGDHCWIGENVWIDNLDNVSLGNDVCLSQGSMLLTGNHDYKIYNMPFRNAQIILEEGVWIGAKSIVCSGVICKSHSILTVGSIATKNLDEFTIYQGNPATALRKRKIE